MTSHPKTAALFDKDAKFTDVSNDLRRVAEDAQLRIVTIDTTQDVGAAIGHLKSCGEGLLFVHLDEDDWQLLLKGLVATKNAVRISNSWLEAARPVAGASGGIGFQCLKRIKDLESLDFAAFVAAFGEEKHASALRTAAYVPDELRGLLRFEPLNRVVTVDLLLKLWTTAPRLASEPGHASVCLSPSDVALTKPEQLGPVMRRLLGAERASDWPRLWECIGREMGLPLGIVKDLVKQKQPNFFEVLAWLESGSETGKTSSDAVGAAGAAPKDEVVEAASRELQQLLAAMR